MPQRKIDVLFYVPNYDDFGTTIPVTRITTAQLKQLQESVANAKLPTDSCISSLSVKYQDEMSFLIGGARYNHMAKRHRTVEISNLFWPRDTHITPCAPHRHPTHSLHKTMRVCAYNLRTGKCKDAFMRNTIGAVLFPKLYAKDKQK